MMWKWDCMNYRAWKIEDHKQVSHIVYDTWISFQATSTQEEGLQKAMLYLQQCLSKSSFVAVAEEHDNIVGVIMAYSPYDDQGIGKCKNNSMVFPTPSEAVTSHYKKSNEAYRTTQQRLGKQLPNNVEARLVLFVVHPKYQGRGYGKKLYAKAMHYLYQTDVDEYYLYTDSSCHFLFYHTMGLQRIAQSSLDTPHRHSHFQLYAYRGNTKQEIAYLRQKRWAHRYKILRLEKIRLVKTMMAVFMIFTIKFLPFHAFHQNDTCNRQANINYMNEKKNEVCNQR